MVTIWYWRGGWRRGAIVTKRHGERLQKYIGPDKIHLVAL